MVGGRLIVRPLYKKVGHREGKYNVTVYRHEFQNIFFGG
jgi:hypothetical protein